MTSFDVPATPDPEDPALAGDESTVPVPEVVLSERDRMPRWIPRAILLFMVGILSLSVFTWLVSRLRSLLLMILVSLFLSFAMEPAVNRLSRRGWRRGVATGAVFLGVVLLFAGFIFAMGSVLADQIQRLIDQAPAYIEDIQAWAERQFNVQIDAQGLIAQFQPDGPGGSLAQDLAGNLVDLSTTVVGLLFKGLTVVLFTYYLVADGPRLRASICSVLAPRHQIEVLRVWNIAIDKTGGYIYSRALLSLLSMLFHWAALAVLGVPFPLALAIWVGVVSQFIPVVGTYLAGLFPILIALLNDPISAVWVLVVIVVYQQIENYLFAPRVTAQTMEIHPAVAFGAVIAGAGILGPVGALLALPAGATIQAFVSSYLQRHELVDAALIWGADFDPTVVTPEETD